MFYVIQYDSVSRHYEYDWTEPLKFFNESEKMFLYDSPTPFLIHACLSTSKIFFLFARCQDSFYCHKDILIKTFMML